MLVKFLASIAVVMVCNSLTFAQKFGEPTPVVNLPESVRKALDVPSVPMEWIVAFRFVEPDEGIKSQQKNWYRIGGREGNRNRLVTVEAYENGEVFFVRIEIAKEDIPAIVNAAIMEQFPDFVPSKYEVNAQNFKSNICYRLEGEIDGTKCAIFSREDGSKVLKTGA